ncbi:MAG: signal peptide peptidase SppA [Cyclobacteriaceae bacterium]|nr:signal peptide peptidase SppA [Cyclobacteriaceae bacterium]
MNFLKTFFASFLAMVVFSGLSLVLVIMIFGMLAADEKVIVGNKSVLHLKLDALITEQEVEDPFAGLPIFGNEIPKIGLLKLKETIRYAKGDPKIEGIFLNVSYPMTGFSSIEEIRESITDFRESGKWVVAYADVMSEQAYYLASAADKVYLNPEGEVEFNGLTVEVTFFKRLFDKLDIKPEIFRVGDFKSAVEPFMLEKMSPENRIQLTDLINSIYDHVLEGISSSRNIPMEKLKEISDNMLAQNGSLAVQYGLVDSLLYYDEVLGKLRERLSLEESAKVKFVRLGKYAKSIEAAKSNPDEIAVIVADGTIMPGQGGDGVVGSDTFAEEMRKARLNKKVKAIVVRVNSPGGAFQASDIMWREVSLAAREKPVIGSMSDYAASGGYYLAMACDTIVAQPHTITGSIGVFSVLFDASGFLNNKIGITFDEVNTGKYGEMVTISRPLTTAEKNVWQRRTDAIYETFTTKAAEGRGMDVEDLKKVASGRVWTGSQAQSRGLVDILGGYNDAIEIAAKVAGIDTYSVKLYPRQKPFFEQLMSQLADNARINSLQKEMGEHYSYYEQWLKLKRLEGPQTRMPFELLIR